MQQGWTCRIALVMATLCATVGLGNTATADAQPSPVPYRFTVVADTAQPRFVVFDGCPAINEREQIAFHAQRPGGFEAIYRSTGNRIDQITPNLLRVEYLDVDPSINDRGEVSFGMTVNDNETIFRGAGGALTTIARTQGRPFLLLDLGTSLTNDGEVAFEAVLDAGAGNGLFVGNGRRTRTYYRSATSPLPGTLAGFAFNERDQMAFRLFPDTGGDIVFRTNGRTFTPIAAVNGPLSQIRDVTLNNRGVVAFQATLDDTSEAIFTGTGGALRTIANSRLGPFSAFGFGSPAINDNGVVAFAAVLDSGEQGLFVGPDPVADRVIGQGDTLAGSTVTDIVFCREGLNSDGDVAFIARLANERSVVVLGRKQ